ncbi:MAG: prolyl oligopeptidase family serine peptidase [Bacteroidia bacterium]|nr:prolyl oligopeptidase family serine peptidase [Bacteroidia bacterium]
MKTITAIFLASLLVILSDMLFAQDQLGYQMPPQAIADLADAAPTPAVSLSPDDQWMLLMQRSSMPSIAELSQPELRIGGLRINPRNNGQSRTSYYLGFRFRSMDDQAEYSIEGLPADPLISNVSWSADGKFIAFTHSKQEHIELWVLEVESRKARKLTDAHVNAAMRGRPYSWISTSHDILLTAIPEGRQAAPQKPATPSGPVISSNEGKVAAVRTYQDLLKNGFDESLFSYFTESQLLLVNAESGVSKKLGEEGIFRSFSPSPDGQYILIEEIKKPFSYLVPYYRFPRSVEIWDKSGNVVREMADLPSGEDIPKGFMSVQTGRRSFSWRADKAASLYWAEALDAGDPKKEVEFRDQVYHMDAPFKGDPKADMKTSLRYSGIQWGDADLAIVNEYWWNTRRRISTAFSPENPKETKVLFDRSTEDRYNDPGNFETVRNEYGRYVLLQDKKKNKLFLFGSGASPEGNKPFVDTYDLENGETERLWRSDNPYYEYPIAIRDVKKMTVLTSRESKEMPANFYIRNLKNGKLEQVSEFGNPYPSLSGIKKELIKYERNDGLPLTGTLYTPPGYDPQKDGPIPVLLWAYPREFKSASAAGQVSGSPNRFVRLYGGSPLFWVARGYAILDGPSMPVIGEGDEEPNDSFVKQLVANAAAAIAKLEEMGVADGKRVAVGGHSYGAFMTANLLAHSDLFACGIARSGAYNRTLTPFGFQSEERTFWESPDIYFAMSPFMHADKVKEPILLIHGEADNNSGTYPLQSQRYYNALKGHGATARLVMLPHESHGYRARESVMHMLWEMDSFMQKHLGKGFKQSSR